MTLHQFLMGVIFKDLETWQIVDLAAKAGFTRANSVRASVSALRAKHGLRKRRPGNKARLPEHVNSYFVAVADEYGTTPADLRRLLLTVKPQAPTRVGFPAEKRGCAR